MSERQPSSRSAADSDVPAADDDALTVALDPAFVLPRRVAAWADQDPERPFLEEVTGRRLTYGATWDTVRSWMAWLDQLGVRSGDRVMTMLPSSVDSVLAWLALGCLGALEVPVNPELRGSFLDHIVEDAGARLALVRPELAGQLSAYAETHGLEVIVVDRDADIALAHEGRPVETWPAPEASSCVIYTSGTTGPAKGVVLSWAQLASTIGRIPRSFFSAQDAAFAFNPMFHVTGRSPLLSMSDVGGRVVLRERFSASTFFDDVRRHGCTTTTVQPALVLATPERADDRDNPLRIVFGSHNPTMSRRFAERFDVSVIDAYGSTEVGFPIVRRWQCDDSEKSCGRLRRGYAARVVDSDGVDVDDGAVGELWIRPPERPLVMLSYLNHPDATAAAFAGDWYRTGDAFVRRPDGTFVFVDRLRDTIRRMGENISASQIETVVDTHPDVNGCAALGVPDPVAGHEVLLAVEPRSEGALDVAELFGWLTDRLPRYMLPAYIAVVDELPRTPTGKVAKTGLAATIDLATAWSAPRRSTTTTRS